MSETTAIDFLLRSRAPFVARREIAEIQSDVGQRVIAMTATVPMIRVSLAGDEQELDGASGHAFGESDGLIDHRLAGHAIGSGVAAMESST